jgi:ABC-type transporter Mla maintaining outer membrane lipid asymmetry ATPase subunit MlaF
VGWVAANGGLISNLKIWENVTLPLWYHARREVIETEQSVMHWLGVLGLEQDAFAEFMAAPPYSTELWQRKLAGLLRALVQIPRVLVVDAFVFEDIKARLASSWISALEDYAAQGHAVLVIADKATALPWEKIE